MYSFRIEQAIRAATVLHKDQVRKGDMPLPYITHLVSVAFILHDYTKDEDVIIAGLLHDAIEDTDYTLEELEQDFGERVRQIVEAVTEPKHNKHGDTLTWQERKNAYLAKLKRAPEEALLVAAADKSHNMRTLVEAYFEEPERMRNDFGGTLDERLEQHQNIANIFNRNLKNAIVHEFNHVFTEYKDFIHSVQTQASE